MRIQPDSGAGMNRPTPKFNLTEQVFCHELDLMGIHEITAMIWHCGFLTDNGNKRWHYKGWLYGMSGSEDITDDNFQDGIWAREENIKRLPPPAEDFEKIDSEPVEVAT